MDRATPNSFDKKDPKQCAKSNALARNSERPRSTLTLDERNVPEGHTARFVGGHPIVFPGKPYPVQFPYMERVVRALDASANALLEAPTGVGKVRSLKQLHRALQMLFGVVIDIGAHLCGDAVGGR